MDGSVFGRLSVRCNGTTLHVVLFYGRTRRALVHALAGQVRQSLGAMGRLPQCLGRRQTGNCATGGGGISDEFGCKWSSCMPSSSRCSRANRPRRTTWRDLQRCDEEAHQQTPSHRQRADEESCSGGHRDKECCDAPRWFSPSEWVLGKLPRHPAGLNEQARWR